MVVCSMSWSIVLMSNRSSRDEMRLSHYHDSIYRLYNCIYLKPKWESVCHFPFCMSFHLLSEQCHSNFVKICSLGSVLCASSPVFLRLSNVHFQCALTSILILMLLLLSFALSPSLYLVQIQFLLNFFCCFPASFGPGVCLNDVCDVYHAIVTIYTQKPGCMI